MKEGRIVSAIVAAAMAVLTLPAPAFAQMRDMPMKDMPMMQHREGHGPMMGMGHMDRMDEMMGMCLEHAEKMGLTGEQIKKLKPLHREMEKKQARFQADRKIAEIDLMEIMEVKDFDLDKADAAVKKLAGIKTAHHLDMLKTMKEVRSVLTDEQFRKMKGMMSMKDCECVK